jgi:hypothetical protein
MKRAESADVPTTLAVDETRASGLRVVGLLLCVEAGV